MSATLAAVALGKIIRTARLALRPHVGQTEMAERIGVSRQIYNGYERGKKPLTQERRQRLQRELGVDLDMHTYQDSSRRVDSDQFALGSMRTLQHNETRRVPVVGTEAMTRKSKLADFWVGQDIVGYVMLPPRLATRTDVRALPVRGTRMEPRYYDGEMVAVGNTRDLTPGIDFVFIVLQAANDDDRRPGLVRRLVALTDSEVEIEQFNPPKRDTILLDDIYTMERVIPFSEFAALPGTVMANAPK